MVKIKLVLADFDSRYLDRVTDYINTVHPAIRVATFTRTDLLDDFLRDSAEQVNILLAHPDFLVSAELYSGIELVAALSDGSICNKPDGFEALFKYQPGDALVSRLISLYSEKNPGAAALVTGENDTKLVSVYSPAGGVGKTSVVLGLAAKLAETGHTVLVLSFESVNSMVSALTCSGSDGMSYLLLSLRENPEVMPVKLEACKTHDCRMNIDFIEPAACFMELSDAAPDDIKRLLTAVKDTGRYDVVLIDMDAAADEKTGAVFSCSDRVVLVRTSDSVCHFKTAEFLRQLGSAFGIPQNAATEKLVPLLNKYAGGPVPGLDGFGLQTEVSIPVINDLWLYENGRCIFDPGGRFNGFLGALARHVLGSNGPAQRSAGGPDGGGRENAR